MNFDDKNPQEIIKEIYKLNVKYRVLESNIESYLGNNRNVSHDFLTKFLNEFRQNSKFRSSDCDKLKNRVINIRLKIEKFKLSIENIQPNEEFVSSIKGIIEEIEMLITELKREQKDSYENLLRSEVSLWQECIFMEKKINSWVSGDNDREVEPPKPQLVSDLINKANKEKNAVIALQKYLDETGGKTGGWSTLDHQTFLRIRLKYTGICQTAEVSYPRDEDIFYSDLMSLLAPKTVNDVKTHEMWYRKYQELVSEKKKAISEWKQQKSKQMKTVEMEIDETPKLSVKIDWETQKKRLENQRQALDFWRAEKALEEHRLKIEKENTEKEEMERKKREQELERKEMRQMVDEYKQRKQAEDGEKRELALRLWEMSREDKKRQIETHSARINERNTRMVEDKLIKQHQKQFEKERKIQRLNKLSEQVAITARRDPSRLLKPTSGWINRLTDTDENCSAGGISSGIRITNVQHKAVPAWRRDFIQ